MVSRSEYRRQLIEFAATYERLAKNRDRQDQWSEALARRHDQREPFTPAPIRLCHVKHGVLTKPIRIATKDPMSP